jgi:hypothetical protein
MHCKIELKVKAVRKCPVYVTSIPIISVYTVHIQKINSLIFTKFNKNREDKGE